MENRIDLDTLEAALAKSTPGEIYLIENGGPGLDPDPNYWGIYKGNGSSLDGSDGFAITGFICEGDARFIVMAHNAFPALIAELRELRAESAAIKARAWQSIETAPKNGTGFLAWNESLRIVEESWWSDNMAGITHWQPFPDDPTHALPMPPTPEAQ